MNRRALIYALIYAALVIAFKLFILLGGFTFTKFGWYYSNITAVLLIIPFYILAIRGVRDQENGGIISGRDAMRIALTVFAVSVVLISVYHYIEFEWKGKALAIEYYRSAQYLDVLKAQPRIKPEQYEKIIAGQIASTETAAFRATTGKLFSFLIVGLSAAFICSASMKRNAR